VRSAAAVDEARERAELLADALSDFDLFLGLLEITPKGGIGRVPFKPTRIQTVYSIDRCGRDLVLKARQIGFTTLELARDIFHWLTVPGANVLILCQSDKEDLPLKDIASKIIDYFECLETAGLGLEFIKGSAKEGHEWHIRDAKGGRAKLGIRSAGASEKSAKKVGRSGTLTRLHCTETSVWEYATQSMNAVLECVPKQETGIGCEIVIESTPNGAGGFFYEYCTNAKTVGFKLHFYPWFEHEEYTLELEPGEVVKPHSDRERFLVEQGVKPGQLKWYQKKLAEKNGSQDLMDQEYPSDPETCFLVSGRTFFNQQITQRLVEKSREPIETRDRDRVRIYAKPIRGRVYVMGVDTSSGVGECPSAAVLYERNSGEHVASIDGHYEPHELARAAAKLGEEYNFAFIAVERENHGHSVLLELSMHWGPERAGTYPMLYVHTDQLLGHPTNPITRPIMLDELQDVHSGGHWASPDKVLLGQMRHFVIGPDGKPGKAPGYKDDLILAGAIGWHIRSIPLPDLSVGGVSGRGRSLSGGRPGARL